MTNINNISTISNLLKQNRSSGSLETNKDIGESFSKVFEALTNTNSNKPENNTLNESFNFSSADLIPKSNTPTGFLVGQINNLNDMHKVSELKQAEVAAGYGDPLEATLAVNKADLNFRLMMEVRNKAVNAFKEILRIQV